MERGFPKRPSAKSQRAWRWELLSWSAISVHQQNGQRGKELLPKENKEEQSLPSAAILDSVDTERAEVLQKAPNLLLQRRV